MKKHRPRRPAERLPPTRSTRPGQRSSRSASRPIIRARLHPRRHGRRHRLQPRGVRGRRASTALDASRHHRDPDRGVDRRLEGVRARGHARPKPTTSSIICSIENLDPMGVHTGDSHHRRPGADPDRQRVPAHARRRVRAVIRARSASRPAAPTSSSPSTPRPGAMIVIEMNPRVSRSSALASKATGFPIAKIAAKLAVGYTLDEIQNDITRADAGQLRAEHRLRGHQDPRASPSRSSPAPSERPRHPDEVRRRGHGHRPHLPRVAAEGPALPRAPARRGFDATRREAESAPGRRRAAARAAIATPAAALPRSGNALRARRLASSACTSSTRIDPWFLAQIRPSSTSRPRSAAPRPARSAPCRWPGPSASAFATVAARPAARRARARRPGRAPGLAACARPTRRVDTCAAEFAPARRTIYSTYEDDGRGRRHRRARRSSSSAAAPTASARASSSTTAASTPASPCARPAIETIMVNCNPETVSTDYDTSRPPVLRAADLEDVSSRSSRLRQLVASSAGVHRRSSAGRRR